MGNLSSTAEILDKRLEETEPRLYWPSPPYEGPVKLRFGCSNCAAEAILLDPFPDKWRDLIGLRGNCFKCNGMRRISVKFVEAGKMRAAIWTFDGGRDERGLATQLQKFIRSGPPAHADREALEDGNLSFHRALQPKNFRATLLPPDFLFSEGVVSQDLKERRKQFFHVVNRHVRTKDSLTIRISTRDSLLADACKQMLAASPEQLRGTLRVTFDHEEAVDWGGVTREFFQVVSEQLLDPRANLFLPKGPNSTFHPSPSSFFNEAHLQYFRFTGRLLAKALIDKRTVKAPFTRAIFKLLLGKPLAFADFQTVDKQTYIQLRQTLEFDDATLDACGFAFAANIEDFGQNKTYPLKEGGEEIPVTRENLCEWVKLYSSWKMVDSVEEQLTSLLFGFYEILPVQAVQLFNEFELEQLLCGLPEINVDDWRKHSVVVGFNKMARERGEWFWEIMEGFSNERRGQVLQFATGSAQVPGSFEHFFPPFTVAFASGLREDHLPYGHTCFNRIDLPYYTTKERMRNGIEKALDLGLIGFAMK